MKSTRSKSRKNSVKPSKTNPMEPVQNRVKLGTTQNREYESYRNVGSVNNQYWLGFCFVFVRNPYRLGWPRKRKKGGSFFFLVSFFFLLPSFRPFLFVFFFVLPSFPRTNYGCKTAS